MTAQAQREAVAKWLISRYGTENSQLEFYRHTADEIIAVYEAAAPKLDPSIIPLDDLSELRMSAVMIRRWIPEVFPENAAGQVHFVRAICDSVATVIERAMSHLPKDSPPMTDPDAALLALAAEVEAADGPRYELECRVAESLGLLPRVPNCTASVDAGLALLAAVQPSRCYTIDSTFPALGIDATVINQSGAVFRGRGKTESLALLAAILRAVAADREGR